MFIAHTVMAFYGLGVSNCFTLQDVPNMVGKNHVSHVLVAEKQNIGVASICKAFNIAAQVAYWFEWCIYASINQWKVYW